MAIRSVFGNREIREKKTLANRDYYKTLIENKKEATFLCDADGDLFLMNKKAQSMTGLNEEEIRDYHIRDLFVTTKSVKNQLDTRQFSEFTAQLFLLDSRRYLIPVIFDFKEIEGQKFLCTCVEAAEAELPSRMIETTVQMPSEPTSMVLPSTRTETQSRWSVDFEHKVRNLLGSILGFGSILAREPLIIGDKKLASNLDSLLKSGNNLKKLFNQGSFNESDSHEVNRTASLLSPVIQKAVILLEPLANLNSQTIQVIKHAEVKVITDEALLLDLLKFLISKAITYTRRNEVLVEISEDRNVQKATVSIDNLGQDIPHGVINFIKRENLKEKYDLLNPIIVQNQEISLILSLLNRIEAKINFITSPSLGEIAQVILPLASESDSIDDVTLLENSIRNKSLKILIIEDEKFSAIILQMYLDKIAEVSIAYSGNEALNIVEIFYNRGIIFNAVISDIGLPSPWDGMMLKSEIERRWPEYQNTPFIAQTAFTAKSFGDRIMEAKFKAMLIKPINRNDILMVIDKYCR
jgi:CheY-like chemotaxis protein